VTPRYAIYLTPGIGGGDPVAIELRDLVDRWLGRSLLTETVEQQSLLDWPRAEIDRITTEPRRYGFHATLKAPFHLRDEYSAADLEQATRRLAARCDPIHIPSLRLKNIAGFLALVPGKELPDLHELANECVTELDTFRAPLTEPERARRTLSALSTRQLEYLERYGYPYVLEEFTPHFTLTNKLPATRLPVVESGLQALLGRLTDVEMRVDHLSLVEEPAPGAPFRIHSLHPLKGTQ
jgi:2'-5' RNA ligase